VERRRFGAPVDVDHLVDDAVAVPPCVAVTPAADGEHGEGCDRGGLNRTHGYPHQTLSFPFRRLAPPSRGARFPTLPVLRFALQKPHRARTTAAWMAALSAGAALLVPGRADAHVTISPTYVDADATSTITFETPNERPTPATVSVAHDAPPAVGFSRLDPPPGWRVDVQTTHVRWSGGRIEGR